MGFFKRMFEGGPKTPEEKEPTMDELTGADQEPEKKEKKDMTPDELRAREIEGGPDKAGEVAGETPAPDDDSAQ